MTVLHSHNFCQTIMSLYGSLCLVWQHTHNANPMVVIINGLVSYAVCSFLIHCSCMPSQKLLYAFRNCFYFKLEQILTIYNSSTHTLLNNLYNSVEAVVISTTSSIFFIQCTGLTIMWILCLPVRWYIPATNFGTHNWPIQKGWWIHFQSSTHQSKFMMGSSLKCYHQQWGTEFPPTLTFIQRRHSIFTCCSNFMQFSLSLHCRYNTTEALYIGTMLILMFPYLYAKKKIVHRETQWQLWCSC